MAPRAPKTAAAEAAAGAEVGLVLDNGGGLIKAGLVPLSGTGKPVCAKPFVATNALAHVGPSAASGRPGASKRPPGFLAAAEIDAAPDFSAMAFRRPHDRGYVSRWDVERDVWASVFSGDKGVGVRDFASTALVLTEPLAMPGHMRRATDELVFETFGFREYAAVPPARLVAEAGREVFGGERVAAGRATGLVLDSGFSFTHAVPVAGGREVTVAARRLNVGGKALTNHLKEMVSFRSWNMMDETAVVNAAKERLCFVSMDYMRDLAVTQMEPNNPIRREYVLPDLSRSGVDPLGHVRGEEEMDGTEQILAMHNERISVPEVLFNPLDVGLPQAGIAELVVQAIEACSARYRADLYANVVLAGGNCCLPNFRQRLVDELRPLVPDIYKLSVSVEEKPILSAFRGGVLALQNPEAKLLNFVTKAEYEEHGSNITLDRFRC